MMNPKVTPHAQLDLLSGVNMAVEKGTDAFSVRVQRRVIAVHKVGHQNPFRTVLAMRDG